MESNNDKGNCFLISLFSNTRTDGYRNFKFQLMICFTCNFSKLGVLPKIPFKLTQSIHVEISPKIPRIQILRKLAPQLPTFTRPPGPPGG